jgi:transposase
LAARIRSEPRAKVARRLTAVRLALLGQAPEQVGSQVLLSARQVRTWITRYNAAGLDGLLDRKGRGRRGSLTAAQEQRLQERLRAGPTPADGVCSLRGEDARRILAEEFGVLRCLQAVYDLLHRPGFAPLRPRPRHPKGDPARQEAFKKSCPEAVAEVASARPGERVEVWFEDEARFGQKGTLTGVWAERGSRPTAPKQTAYANLQVLTAVCPATGRTEGLVAPRLNAGVVQAFLD